MPAVWVAAVLVVVVEVVGALVGVGVGVVVVVGEEEEGVGGPLPAHGSEAQTAGLVCHSKQKYRFS